MRILVISDLHANLVALDAVIKDAGQFDRVWCLGDIVGYGPQPNECIGRLKQFDLVCVAGNHDWAALDKIDLEEFNPDAGRAVLWTRRQLTRASCDWLSALPERVPTQAEHFTLAHGSPRYPVREYLLTPAVARTNFEYFETAVCLVGHTHIPKIYRAESDSQSASAESLPEGIAVVLKPKRVIVNPGSVGQPRDGDPRAAYAILDPDELTVTHFRKDYDIATTQARMEHAQLPKRLIQRLSFGW